MKKFTLLSLGLLLATACTDDKPQTTDTPSPGLKNVWVLNEGNFGSGNSKLGVYNTENGEYSKDVFASVNNRPLGDVLQSATQIGNEVYLVVNNSGKIEAVNSKTFESTGTITGFNSPRYVLPVSPSEAYVSDIFSDSVAVINLATKQIHRYIDISTGSNQMVMAEGKVFLANTYNTSFITVIDVATEAVTTIGTTAEPTAMGLDRNGKVWVLCGGGGLTTDNGALEVIDPVSEQVIKTIELGRISYTNRLAFNEDRDSLYFLTSGVYKMSIDATTAPATAFIEGSNFTAPYALGYNTVDGQVWVSDAIDFSQQGKVFIYNRNGSLKNSFTAGINPNEFWFGN